jgi:hypothetical protein
MSDERGERQLTMGLNAHAVGRILCPVMDKRTFTLPPLENADAHSRALAKLRGMSTADFKRTLVRAGIHTADGKLAPEYAEESATPVSTR